MNRARGISRARIRLAWGAYMANVDYCTTGKPGTAMTVDAARLRALAAVSPLRESETLGLEAALGRIAATGAAASVNLPPFDNAAMDGYALRTADLHGPGPWTLKVEGRVAAGDPAGQPLRPGTANRILTGAPLPPGADAVVMQERVTRVGSLIQLDIAPDPGTNIRRQGEDVAAGSSPVAAGLCLTAPRLAVLAGCGIPSLPVYRRLRVAMFSTGNELQEPGRPLAAGQIYNSNRVMLRALLTCPWIALSDLGILRDDPGAIRSTIRDAAASHDVVISTGGVSAGDEDHILDALRREDATLDVLKVAIRPGKPLTVGRVGGALFIGLPGNPYATAITFTQIAQPALRRAAGQTETPDTAIPCVADFDYARTPGRREYVPVTWDSRDAKGRPILHRLGQGASASLSPLAVARGIAALPADLPRVGCGTPLMVEPL